MKKVMNLNDIKQLDINEKFIFGEFEGEAVEWTKVSANLAISDRVLDCIIYDYEFNNNKNEIVINKWCNDVLGKRLGLDYGVVTIPLVSFMKEHYSLQESRKVEPTEIAIMRGVSTGYHRKYSPYWLLDKPNEIVENAFIVTDSGDILSFIKNAQNIGVRPALKLD